MSEEIRCGIFICRCGPNIADRLHFEELKEQIKKLPDVVGVYEDNFYCSPAGKNKIKEIIKQEKLNRCCFAACSHRVHEKTFMETVVEAGINPFLIQLANIREHITWVMDDKEKATKRAYDQIKAAVARLRKHKALETKYMKIKTDVAIIGGGIAGIKAAKLLANDKNRTIYLIDSKPTLGGRMPQWEKSYPTMDCNPCFLAPELSEMKDIKNIKVLTNTDIEEIKGFYGNFIIKIKVKPRYINENCIGCMECFNACPVSVKNEFNANLNDRKAVYIPFPGSYPNLAIIDEKNCLRFKGEECTKCKEVCDALFGAVDYSQKAEEKILEVGGIIVATGFDFIDIKEFPEYNWTGKNNVFTNLEFERMMSSSGPTHSHIKTRKNSDPKSVAFIYCGGRKKVGYCSGVCCGATMKYAKFLLSHNPDTKIYQLYSEMCLDSDGLAEMFESLKKEGVNFIKIDDYKEVKIEADENRAKIKYKEKGIEKSLETEMAVVAMGIQNSDGSNQIAKLLDLPLTKEGWFAKYHAKMEPSTSAVDGVYIAGACAGPVDVQKAVVSAKAAAGEAMAKLIEGKEIELESKISYVVAEKCGGCKMCISVCPYKAITFDEEEKHSVIQEALCKGCGTCAALCPANAIVNKHFEDEQIMLELERLIV
ncbi:MAG TPA: CoB--CoM heterodisulfide reductase iron-sulfur subunit A family protein [bacterium]|nr:CoB--CoM heterodisulfide reductase iron-sulfur subunit A family protein [bacterium]HOL47745.1 CoB--CoM heterodisulfide reductase iron-sulfur subunit A family protein [bacterium]HPQ17697.1 CoB--CoM heterodisulfide reductase iron-sulfur subunit A family protein [bacterium]